MATAVVVALASTFAFAQTSPPGDASVAKPADNSRTNMRDRSDTALTPTDQPNDAADIKVAAAVRRSITKDHALSTMAHNIKLIAQGGKVTLRGPVKSEDEKVKIEQLARSAPGVSSVSNELDIAH